MRKPRPKVDHPYVFSVSQVQNFRRCPRKWAYEKIDGLVDPGSSATELGGLVHDELEHYLESGRPISTKPQGCIAMSALPHLPPPRFPGMEIEKWFTLFLPGVVGKGGEGAYFQGLIDVEIPGGWRRAGVPFVSDHKTTTAFSWAKTEEDLTGGVDGVGDVQAGLYAYKAMLESEERTGASCEEVDLQWTYLRTTGAAAAQPTIATISEEQVERVISKLLLTAQEMITTRDENPTALTVVQDPTGCDAFGGCCFKDKCKLGTKEKLRAFMTQAQTEVSVMQRLKERKAAKEAKGAATSEEPEKKSTISKLKERKIRKAQEELATDAVVNPPESALPPDSEAEETAEEASSDGKEPKAKRGKPAAPGSVSAKLAAATRYVSWEEIGAGLGAQGALSRALDAFWNVLADDIASRVAEKIKK